MTLVFGQIGRIPMKAVGTIFPAMGVAPAVLNVTVKAPVGAAVILVQEPIVVGEIHATVMIIPNLRT